MIVLGFAFVAGLLTVLAPCTLPVIPLVLGSSVNGGSRRVAGIFIGFGASFVAVSVLFAAALAAAGLTTDGLRLAMAGVLGIAGLALVWRRLERWVEARFTGVQRSAIGQQVTGGLAGGLVVGAGIGLIWAPCVGPIMAAVIAAAAVAGPSPFGIAASVAYVTGAVIPLSIIARFGRRATKRISAPAAGRVRRGFGVAMVLASAVVLTGLDVPLQARLTETLPGLSTALFAVEQNPAVEEGLTVVRPSSAPPAGSVPLDDLGPAPELSGITAWINSDPMTIQALRGKVVLVHFWTFGCINCIHVQPYVKAWYARYADQGFVVIGVHTPELSFERDLANVRKAVDSDGLKFAVAFDPAFATWNAYRNSYWPAFYFVDRAGKIRHVHYGEGDYDGSEAVIRELLAEPPPA